MNEVCSALLAFLDVSSAGGPSARLVAWSDSCVG